MCRYNNKTYRIDDIDWDHNPTFEFETKRGKITMVNYYKEVSCMRYALQVIQAPSA